MSAQRGGAREAMSDLPFERNFEFLRNLGATCESHMKNAMLERQNGVPLIVHTPYFADWKGCADGCIGSDGNRVNYTEQFLSSLAAFLVVTVKAVTGFSQMDDPNDEYQLGGWQMSVGRITACTTLILVHPLRIQLRCHPCDSNDSRFSGAMIVFTGEYSRCLVLRTQAPAR